MSSYSSSGNPLQDKTWFKMYDELKRFKRREGHCNVPQKYTPNKILGSWVNRQRVQYRNFKTGRPSTMTQKRRQALDEIDFTWSLKYEQYQNSVSWYQTYDELRQFKDREGHCNVPQRYNKNPSLGRWVHTQRVEYKNMAQGHPFKINMERIKALDDLGFKWSTKDDFESCSSSTTTTKATTPPRRISRHRHDNDDVNDENKKKYREGSICESWYEKYEELKKFKEREGHCNVTRGSSIDNASLAQWVHYQRYKYKRMTQGQQHRAGINKEQIKALDDIGFQWNLKDDKGINGHKKHYFSESNTRILGESWYQKYQELLKFKHRNGHCNVIKMFKDNPSLGRWVHTQRYECKKMIKGQHAAINEQRIKALYDIGFQWSLKNDDNIDVNDYVKQLKVQHVSERDMKILGKSWYKMASHQKKRHSVSSSYMSSSSSSSLPNTKIPKGALLNFHILHEFPNLVDGKPSLFIGTLVNFQPRTSLYRVKFLDGDSEDLHPSQAWECVVLYHEQYVVRQQPDTTTVTRMGGLFQRAMVWEKDNVDGEKFIEKNANPKVKASDLSVLNREEREYWASFSKSRKGKKQQWNVEEETDELVLQQMMKGYHNLDYTNLTSIKKRKRTRDEMTSDKAGDDKVVESCTIEVIENVPSPTNDTQDDDMISNKDDEKRKTISSSASWLLPDSSSSFQPLDSHPPSTSSTPPHNKRHLTFAGESIILSVHDSTIPNAGKGLFLTYAGDKNQWEPPTLCDLGRYGPHRSNDIKSRVVFEAKNFMFAEKPSEWSFMGPSHSTTCCRRSPYRSFVHDDVTYDDNDEQGMHLFGKMVNQDVYFDITCDVTGDVHEEAQKTLLPFVNEKLTGHAMNHRRCYNVIPLHHDDGSLHYVLKEGCVYKAGERVELFVDYGSEYEMIRQRKYSCKDRVGDSSTVEIGGDDDIRKINEKTNGHQQQLETQHNHHQWFPYATMRKRINAYTNDDVLDVLRYFVSYPPQGSHQRCRMKWIVEQISCYCTQLLFYQMNGAVPDDIADLINKALCLFPRQLLQDELEDDDDDGMVMTTTQKMMEDAHRDRRVATRCQYLGCGVRRYFEDHDRYSNGMVEMIVGNDDDDDNDGGEDRDGMRYLVVFFNGRSMEMNEEEVEEVLIEHSYGFFA